MEYSQFKTLIKETDAGSRIVVLAQYPEFVPALFFDTEEPVQLRTEAGRFAWDYKIPLDKRDLDVMVNDSNWDARRWAALFLYYRFDMLHLLNDPDWKCRKFAEFLELT